MFLSSHLLFTPLRSLSGWPITVCCQAQLHVSFFLSSFTAYQHLALFTIPSLVKHALFFLLRTRFSSCFCGLFCLAVFSGSNLTKFWILKFLIAWHWVLFIFSLHYIPMALKTIYMLITPKFISWARLFPQCFFFIYPNYLLGNFTCVFLKCLKLNVLYTKLLLLPMETYFSMDLLSLSKWYVILPDCCNKNLIVVLFCPLQHSHIQSIHKMVDLPSEYIFYCLCYYTNSLTGTLLSLLPPINIAVRIILLKHKLCLFTFLLKTLYFLYIALR